MVRAVFSHHIYHHSYFFKWSGMVFHTTYISIAISSNGQGWFFTPHVSSQLFLQMVRAGFSHHIYHHCYFFKWSGLVFPTTYIIQLQIRVFFVSTKKSYFSYFSTKMWCEYPLEVPHRGTSNEYPQHTFSWRNKKIFIWLLLWSEAMMDHKTTINGYDVFTW